MVVVVVVFLLHDWIYIGIIDYELSSAKLLPNRMNYVGV